jgi:hypothetical protein
MSKTWFSSEDKIAAIADGVIHRTLPKPEWTHAAHFACALHLIRHRGMEATLAEMPALIRAYNTATGVANTDSEGYHETITLASIRAAASVLDGFEAGTSLDLVANALMAGPLGESKWLLAYWSRERLISAEARRGWVEPDVASLNFPSRPSVEA